MNGERHGAIADLVDVAIDGDEADTENCRVGALQLGDVIGDRAGMVRSEFLVAGGQKPLQRRLVGVTGISGGKTAFGRTGNLGVHIITLNGKSEAIPVP